MKLIVRHFYLLLLSLALLILVFCLGFLGSYLAVGPDIPNVDSLRDTRLQTPMSVYSNNGQLLAEYGQKRRIPITLDEVPQDFINALIATEDQRFFEHSGVDFVGVGRAAINLINTGRKSQGASTITMLVARNYFLTRQRTFKRKITEMFLAWRIESELSKNQILELLLNKIPFGHRAFGLGAASQVYYGKELKQLTLSQLAVLAGIPKGQSKYNPISYPENALNRRAHVLNRMLEEGFISDDEFQSASKAPITAKFHGADVVVDAPYFTEMVRQEVVRQFGIDTAYNFGLKVYTTLDIDLQSTAQMALRKALISYDKRHGYRGPEQTVESFSEKTEDELLDILGEIEIVADLEPAIVLEVAENSIKVLKRNGDKGEIAWSEMAWAAPFISDDRIGAKPKQPSDVTNAGDLVRVQSFGKEGKLGFFQLPQVNGAFTALSPQNGAVLALVGGFDYNNSKFNRAVQAKRQIGSSIKPFIYSYALEQGYTAASIVNDAPITLKDVGNEGMWRPKNDSGKYKGLLPLRTALRLSINTISTRLVQDLGIQSTKNYLTQFGFAPENLPETGSLALGAADYSPLQLATAYATLANGGFGIESYFIRKITDSNGNVLYESAPKIVCETCLKDQIPLELPNNNLNLTTNDENAHATTIEVVQEEKPVIYTIPELDPDAIISGFPKRPVAPSQVAERKIEERNNYIITHMMRDVIKRGTATRTINNMRPELFKRNDLAGKTGTTNEARDAWFSGFGGNYVATAWVGFDDHSRGLGRNEYGGKAALPIWVDFMWHALKDMPSKLSKQPANIVMAKIDPKTARLATSQTPNPQFEIFRVEQAPKELSEPEPIIETNPFDAAEPAEDLF
ncbi:MAG: penicillin-binding protein 1A [Pseudomonadota bacterium]